MRKQIDSLCPPGEVCDLEQLKIDDISIVDRGAVKEANAVILKNKEGNMTPEEEKKVKEEEDKKKAKKPKEEEIDKADIKSAAAQCVKLLEAVDATGKEETRLRMLIGNLKSLAGIKKSFNEDEEAIGKLVEDIAKKVLESIEKKKEKPSIKDIMTMYKKGYITEEELGKLAEEAE